MPLDGVQMLRAVAALSVLVHHVFEESYALFPPGTFPTQLVLVGASGVDLFFAISGFIMLHTTWRQIGQPDAGRTFLRRRALRVLPLYWVCLTLFFLAKGAGLYRSYTPTPYDVVASVALLPSGHLALSVAWTLVFEMYFYVLFAAWMRAPRRGLLVLGVPLTGLLLASLAAQLPPSEVRHFLTYPVALEFVFGLLLAYRYRHAGAPRGGAWIALAGLALLACSVLFTAGIERAEAMHALRFRFLYWGLPMALVLYGALGLTRARSRAGRLLCALGDASYAIYLTHSFVMTAYARLLKSPQLAALVPVHAWIVLITTFSVVLGCITHRLVERPLSRVLHARVERTAR
ncbi:MAG: acyltransferase [Polyangiales bacterium]